MDQASSSSNPISASSTSFDFPLSPAIDRYNPIIRDSRRTAKPISPIIITKSQKDKKRNKKKNPPLQKNEHQDIPNGVVKLDDEKIKKIQETAEIIDVDNDDKKRLNDFTNPASSARYLLSNKLVVEKSHEFNAVKTERLASDGHTHSLPREQDQVVVLRVSLHCRGCERKLRKHLSKMEGVESFNIDFAAKKVMVTGNVTPLNVLSSISKVKNTQLWSPMISSSIPTN